MKPDERHPVLILGAGINGAAVARELLLNGISVVVVDNDDIASGATARSSRLIHGGLRYLEYADIRLVRESLHERTRLHQLAPQFVNPLQLHIPVATRLGGVVQSTLKFLQLKSLAEKLSTYKKRGMWLVRIGLWLYDRMVTDSAFPNSSVTSLNANDVPSVDIKQYRWFCSYWDAQILYPERFVIAMFHDAKLLAREKNSSFQLHTYHNIQREGNQIKLIPVVSTLNESDSQEKTITPAFIINASGAWGDLTLDGMGISHNQLLGGTKGSHCLMSNKELRKTIGDAGIYAEAPDDRPVFLLPFVNDLVLVGTTDISFTERPEDAIASEEELVYLLGHVQNLFPQISISREDINMHYSGVRPLPYAPKGKAAAISRGHSIHSTEVDGMAIVTLIGGKLTTCRAFAEDVLKSINNQLQLPEIITSRNRLFPGADDYPQNETAKQNEWKQLAEDFQIDINSIEAMWKLCGTDTREFLKEHREFLNDMLIGTALPRSFVQWIIKREWITTLDDLVERRLMLLFQPHLSRQTLSHLAESLVETGEMKADDVSENVQQTIDRLKRMHGKII